MDDVGRDTVLALVDEAPDTVGKTEYDNLTVSTDVASRDTTSTASEQPTYSTLYLLASLTLSIGLFNLLPFPALDGGRIIFTLPELIFRKRVPHQVENAVHAAGMLFLLLLMVYINVMDFVNPIVLPQP